MQHFLVTWETSKGRMRDMIVYAGTARHAQMVAAVAYPDATRIHAKLVG